MRRRVAFVVFAVAAFGACEQDGTEIDTAPTTGVDGSSMPDRFPDVIDVDASYERTADTWTFAVTMTSPYDSPDRYADGWRIIGPDGTVYGVHTLAHDHAAEQPFTRRQSNVVIPTNVDVVTVEGRDQEHGFGGQTVTVTLLR